MTSIRQILWIGLLLIVTILSEVDAMDPKFDPSTRMRLVLIPADATVGSVIYRLRATDEEFDYPLTFELTGNVSSPTVQIESLPCTKYNSVCQANVILLRRLEPGRYYDFQVSVKDTKGGMATQLCSITATNFTTPHDTIFPHKPGIILIPEDAKRGTELDYVIARKNPLFSKPVYLELWGSPLFAIRQKIVSPDTTEGTIFLLGPLDFEKQAMYHLTVLANDAYAEPGQDTRNIAGLEVVVIVQDVQDVAPVFRVAPPVTKLPPGLIPGDKVLQVHAEDGDKGNPREIRYGLVSEGNPFTSFFNINDTTGEIFLVRPLDEIAAITHIGDPVLLTVIAEEVKVGRDEPPAMDTTVELAFFLPERSNSPPYFENDHYVSRIDENAPQGTALTFNDPYVPRVYDDDTGKNGVFSLTLLNNNGTFEISPNVAERSASFLIRVRDNEFLDYEERKSVEFQILAQELGPATNLSAMVNVTVFINDVNDNPPVFSESMYTVELPENMTAGTKVVQVHAEDVDTGMGGHVRYTQILGYLNTSLNLDAATGLVTVSTDNHGFDREVMPEYHLYIEARDNEGTGNRAQVPLIIKMIDVNDETPIFEKPVYEFILSPDLRNFTTPAFIKAIDNDATPPNNEVRYEIINGNYENKFDLNKMTGEITVRDLIVLQRRNKRKRRQINSSNKNEDSEVFVLTARAYDLGVPVRFSTTTIRIYPPESRARTVTFIVPGSNPDRKKTEETLSTITGGHVTIQDIRPLVGDEPGAKNLGGDAKERSVVTATVLYDGNSFVDISQIQQRLSQHNSSYTIMTREEQSETIYRAENRLLFWLLILLAVLIAVTILILLLCCICSWCPLYSAASKRVINVGSTEDDVHLVHRENANGKQTKSVQVAEWMGRREAWSAEKTSDPRTKPTRWEFSRRVNYNEKLADDGGDHIDSIESDRRARSADDRKIRIKNHLKDMNAAKETHFHNSRTNLINDRDAYIEDVVDEHNESHIYRNQYKSKHGTVAEERHIDDDSMRRHEIDRGSDIDYGGRSSLKRQSNRELYIKDGNAEILQLMTRGKQDEENIYVNVPPKAGTLTQPQFVMVDNSGKEILMRRFIEEQPDGKQIIREHYQIVPGATYIQTMPNEVQNIQTTTDLYGTKSGANSVVYSQMEPEVKVIHTQPVQGKSQLDDEPQLQPAVSNQSLIQQELEQSLKQQNALLRQILLEKEKLEERYNQQEVALETQSLPCHSMAIATQTDCEAGTQTDAVPTSARRRARSENDDSMSDDDYEYIRYSPPNSPNGVYWIKRKRHKKKIRYRPADKPRKRIVMVEEVKRKIRTPIKEESEEAEYKRRSPTKEKKVAMLKKMKGDSSSKAKLKQSKSSSLDKDLLMEISDSLDEQASPDLKDRKKHRIHVKEVAYYDSQGESDGDEIVIRRNTYSESGEEYTDDDDSRHIEIRVRDGRSRSSSRRQSSPDHKKESTSQQSHKPTKSVPATPPSKPRLSRKDAVTSKEPRRQTTSEPPNRASKRPAPKPPAPDKQKQRGSRLSAQSETDLVERVDHEDVESTKSVPKYMEWYYAKKKGTTDSEGPSKSEDHKSDKVKPKAGTKKPSGGSDRRPGKARPAKPQEQQDEGKQKPEPMPRKSPPKGARLLKEDILVNKNLKPRIETEANHPLLQHSEHHFERKYDPAPDIPVPPTKLPHYLYPETPPFVSGDSKKKSKDFKPKPSPIKENEVKVSSTGTTVYIDGSSSRKASTAQSQSKQLNAATLEDDHDSGIAMNSLLHSMGRRNPIAEKKSVFTIAYDNVNQVKRIPSESESPPFS
ncbi:cadherin-86C isoform X2 [Hermetia illucens]|nr:cadherin-86C isoform X2 [Hermetia illucens]XP_037916863.1 cadherin-86C isoform X2 [Hermetia illucens]